MAKEIETTQFTQDSQSIDYLKKSLTIAHLQQQLQNPTKSPVQGNGGQSSQGNSTSTGNNK